MSGLDFGIELHAISQCEFVGQELGVSQSLWLWSEVFRPVPFVEDFLGECEVVGVAF